MTLTSMSFYDGKALPAKNHLEKGNRSPDLAFHEVPSEAKSLALLCDDPDAPSGSWAHWVVWDIPPSSKGLREGVPPLDVVPDACHQGKNDFGSVGWGGPCPPPGTGLHRYVFTLYALDMAVGPRKGLGRHELVEAIWGHVIAEASMTGTCTASP
jgi:Raf kinase inhibitor-like YbhB/YbcL family protein